MYDSSKYRGTSTATYMNRSAHSQRDRTLAGGPEGDPEVGGAAGRAEALVCAGREAREGR